MSELFDDLKKLAEMRDKGEVTQAEYEKIKAELLADLGDVAPSDESDTPTATSERATTQPTPPRSRASDAGEWLGEAAPRRGESIPSDIASDLSNLLKRPLFWLVAAIIFSRHSHQSDSARRLRRIGWDPIWGTVTSRSVLLGLPICLQCRR